MKRTKQITRWIIALAGLMIATGAVQAKDYDFKYNGLYYKITKKINFNTFEVKVVPEKAASPYYSAGNEPTGAVTIPKDFTLKTGSFIRTYHVTEIGDRAFCYCSNITSVSIPNSVKTIGNWAFADCTALQSIDIPANVKTIGKGAFSDCRALKSVTLPNGIQEIGEDFFYCCMNLQSIHIPASVKTIGQWAFESCHALKSVTLPDGIPEIKEGTFSYCFALQSIDIPASVTAIGKKAFCKCTDLQSIHIPASVKTIGEAAFLECKLKSVTLPDGIQEIKAGTFWNCPALQSIDIPASVTTIGKEAFRKCTGLKTVTVHWDAPLAVPDNVFEDVITANVTLKVPDGKEAAYKAHTVWGKFKFEGGSTPPPPPPPAILVTSVTLSHHKVTVNGDITQKQLTATVQPATATNKSLTWKSSDAAVASVDADGLVTIHKKGKATVTANANDGSGQSDTCLFDVISTVANETVDGLRVYAADGALHLTLPSPETAHIYHVDGAMVKTLVLPAGDHVQPLPSGVYVVRVGERVTKILIK